MELSECDILFWFRAITIYLSGEMKFVGEKVGEYTNYDVNFRCSVNGLMGLSS